MFYLSSNWYDNNNKKHDDRLGDVLIFSTGALALGAQILKTKLNDPEEI
ncbi:MAG: hypothetical protein AAB459_02260 [Patescibacteria group bacterium]